MSPVAIEYVYVSHRPFFIQYERLLDLTGGTPPADEVTSDHRRTRPFLMIPVEISFLRA